MKLREWGVAIGDGVPGQNNAITDVAGVRVGSVSLWEGDGALVPGTGPVRTGVTAVWPAPGNVFEEKICAAVEVHNGFTKCVGLTQVEELRTIETPILMTNTLNVGKCMDALIAYLWQHMEWRFVSANSVVVECNDSFLNDIVGRHVGRDHVYEALNAANDGPVAEGNAGAGMGMSCYGFKGGLGTSSRAIDVVGGSFTVGTLVCANMGAMRELRVDGVRVGEVLAEDEDRAGGPATPPAPGPGSIVMLAATDAPLDGLQLKRLARRMFHGLARTGSNTNAGSGDVAVAWSTANRVTATSREAVETRRRLHDSRLSRLFAAVADSTEESILNALWQAETVTGRDGNTSKKLPLDRVARILRQRGYDVPAREGP
jgi:D-aminopeptidase